MAQKKTLHTSANNLLTLGSNDKLNLSSGNGKSQTSVNKTIDHDDEDSERHESFRQIMDPEYDRKDSFSMAFD